MEDTARTEIVNELKQVLEDHKGMDTVAIDLRGRNMWTDYFLITTVASQGHLRGMVRHVSMFLKEKGIKTNRSFKHVSEEGWVLIDCGFFVIHIMDKEKRAFYELERLWQD